MGKVVIIWISILVVFLRSSCFNIPISLGIYYGWFFFVAAYLLIKPFHLNKATFYFILVAIFSILMNDIAEFYKPWQRLIGFILLIICVGPLLVSKNLVITRLLLYKIFNRWLIAVSLGSFVGYCIQLPFCFGRSGFNGLMNHSMLLGPVAAISSLVSLSYYFEAQSFLKKYLYLFISILSILTCLLSASRAALLALLFSLVTYLYFIYRHNLFSFIKIIIILFLVIGLSFPLWMPYASHLIEKQTSRMVGDAILSGRDKMWEDRIADFISSPIYGVGFNSMKNIDNSKIDIMEGKVEPGSGWLFIFSTMGLLGFLLSVKLIICPVYAIYKAKYNLSSFVSLIAAILVFFSLHIIVEGYIVSSGSFLFFYSWLCIACVQKESLVYLDSFNGKQK